MTVTTGPGTATRRGGQVGDSPARPDGRQKVTGEFAYSSDLWLDGMLWGATLRSPHPRARITGLDIAAALALPGVAAVLTHDDVPGNQTYGLEFKDQPVLAIDQVGYQGEAVALVAADHPETARRAIARITARYDVLPPVVDARAALTPEAPSVHAGGNLVRRVHIRRGRPDARAEVIVNGEYQVGMQDQAFLGPESGLAVPAEDGGVDLFVATQWLHADRGQVAASLRLPEDKVRITLSGVGGAFAEGSVMPTGQVVDSAAPVAEVLRLVKARPLPAGPQSAGATGSGERDLRTLPGGVSNTTHGEGVVRGVGYAVGIKNVCFSEGFDDYSTARVRLELAGGEATAQVQTAAAEVGQGLVTVLGQIARTELGIERVVILPADTSIGSAGSSSASRQTYVTGGAVRAACQQVREQVLRRARERFAAGGELVLADGQVRGADGDVVAGLGDLLDEPATETVTWRHRPTHPLDPETGQGDAHVQYAFAAHRAVVDVDTELGLVKVVEIATAQDVGRAMNPQAVQGQIHGGIAQGLGLAIMEEIQVVDGVVKNPSFTDYLIPTILDMPPVRLDVLELADPHAPYGLRGVGEPPTISSTPAVVAAIRVATGLDLTRVPVRPEHIAEV